MLLRSRHKTVQKLCKSCAKVALKLCKLCRSCGEVLQKLCPLLAPTVHCIACSRCALHYLLPLCIALLEPTVFCIACPTVHCIACFHCLMLLCYASPTMLLCYASPTLRKKGNTSIITQPLLVLNALCLTLIIKNPIKASKTSVFD